MPSLVLELQKDALLETSVARLLHKAIATATKLRIQNFLTWGKSESNGYLQAPLPDYRVFTSELKVWNPYNGWIPVRIKDRDILHALTRVHIFNSVVEVEAWLATEGDHIRSPLPAKLEQHLDLRGLAAARFVSKSSLSIVPARVRSYILDWSLELEKQGIFGEGMTFTAEEKNKAEYITHIHNAPQYQNNGSVGAMGDSARVGREYVVYRS